MAQGSLTLLQEEAYYKVLKAFAAGSYDLKKEMMLAKLRKELSISDQRHAELRKMIEEGKELGGRIGEAGGTDRRERELHSRPPQGISAHDHPNKRQRGDPYQQPAASDRYASQDGFGYAKPPVQPPDSPFQMQPSSKRAASQTNGVKPARPAKRLRKDSTVPPPDHSRQQPQAVPPPGGSDINELIGYKIERYWPENGGWFEGAITDYRSATGEHCVVYDMNLVSESYEWFNMAKARRDEYRILDERINIIEHAPATKQPNQYTYKALDPKAPPRKPGGGSRGRGLAGGRGRGRGERILPSQTNGRQGHPGHDYDQTAYHRPPSSKQPNGSAASRGFIVESDDESSSDESFSD